MFLGQVNIDLNTTIIYSLKKILGLNYYSIIKICSFLGLNPYSKFSALDENELQEFKFYIEHTFKIGLGYNKNQILAINKLKLIKNLKGIKHLQ